MILFQEILFSIDQDLKIITIFKQTNFKKGIKIHYWIQWGWIQAENVLLVVIHLNRIIWLHDKLNINIITLIMKTDMKIAVITIMNIMKHHTLTTTIQIIAISVRINPLISQITTYN